VGFVFGVWLVLDSNGDNEAIAGFEVDVFVSQSDGEATRKHQEQVVRLVVTVPDELSLTLTTMTSCPLKVATVRGDQCSSICASFDESLMALGSHEAVGCGFELIDRS
jgi:hypothetical protein